MNKGQWEERERERELEVWKRTWDKIGIVIAVYIDIESGCLHNFMRYGEYCHKPLPLKIMECSGSLCGARPLNGIASMMMSAH